MKIGIVQFPGSNCERETIMAVKRAGMQPVEIFWNAEAAVISDCQGYVIVGGFSYQDRIRSGVIAAKSAIMQLLATENDQHGKPILGLCNGAQILVESGLVPGLPGSPLSMALYDNQTAHSHQCGFYNDHINLKPLHHQQHHAFTNQFLEGETIDIPYAHAQGRFTLPKSLLNAMIEAQLPLFQYQQCNPNGSDFDLAAVTNFAGNVMAMMPHPERITNGDKIFFSMRNYIEQGCPIKLNTDAVKSVRPQFSQISEWHRKEDVQTLLIGSVIEDNTATSLQLFLKQQGYDVKVSRFGFWQWQSNSETEQFITELEQTGEIYNQNKEFVLMPEQLQKNSLRRLVVDKEPLKAKGVSERLQKYFEIDLTDLSCGELFTFEAPDSQLLLAVDDFLVSQQLLFNPYVQDCYVY